MVSPCPGGRGRESTGRPGGCPPLLVPGFPSGLRARKLTSRALSQERFVWDQLEARPKTFPQDLQKRFKKKAKLLCCSIFLDISMKWTTQEPFLPKYLHYDPETSRQLMCDKCPPGTYLKQHCTTRRKTVCAPCPDQYYTDSWHTSEECLYCTPVCKELQHVQQECSRTHNRVCACQEGRYLEVEFCLKHRSCPPGFGVAQAGTYLPSTCGKVN
ncbi:PREDICTED: tumor necrosis factor receptor superfamily member 11B-like [Chrysochloris asiatica]|uniref:Tumor necrosis factor receptor superfamily member 11B-like n=1 Tax=Chrysochloris asiatica TaxID=185453 RepID=A0A9B0T2L7_CHRAS|nr:PREDICTED: tumor necrosis factor receptor superfamily member 11B-like [Chrysochloris asiatica]